MPEITATNYLQEALICAKSNPPNADGTFGCELKPETLAARLWQAYFTHRQIPHGYMLERLRAGKTYWTPTQMPQEFDPSWRVPRLSDVKRNKLSSEMSEAERMQALYRLSHILPQLRKHFDLNAKDNAA